MGTLKQDYKNWKKAKAETKYCVTVMDNYQQSIEVKLPYEEWQRNFAKIGAFCEMMKPYKAYADNPNTHAKFTERYDVLAKHLRSSYCFMGCRKNVDILGLGIGIDIEDSTLRCVNNRANGDIVEHLCDGCDKFRELVKYQMLASNAKVAKQRCVDARKTLLNHFKLSKTK